MNALLKTISYIQFLGHNVSVSRYTFFHRQYRNEDMDHISVLSPVIQVLQNLSTKINLLKANSISKKFKIAVEIFFQFFQINFIVLPVKYVCFSVLLKISSNFDFGEIFLAPDSSSWQSPKQLRESQWSRSSTQVTPSPE